MDEAAQVEEVVEEEEKKEPRLRVWDLSRVDEEAMLASLLGKVPELWNDNALRDPVYTFKVIYKHPNSTVFEIGERAGMIAVVEVVPGFRGKVVVAAWEKEAMRVPELWRRAIRAAMISHDLLLVEGLIAEDNELSINAAESVGFELRGRLRRPSYYNGQPKTLRWYTLTREAVGLED